MPQLPSERPPQLPPTRILAALRFLSVVTALLLGGCITPLAAQEAADSARQVFSSRAYPWYDAETDSVRPINFPPRPPSGANQRDQIPDAPPRTQPSKRTTTAGGANAVSTGFSMIAWIGLGSMIAALIALLLWAFFRLESQSRSRSKISARRSLADSIKHLPFPVDHQIGDLRSAAQAAYQSGDYRNGIIFLYSHVLVSLDEHELIRLQRGRTNRQYLRDLKLFPAISRYFESVMQPFEAVFFGDHQLTQSEFESRWNGLDPFLTEMEQIQTARKLTRQTTSQTYRPDVPTISAPLPETIASVLLLSLSLLFTGCQPAAEKLVTDYGTITSERGNTSVNGTSVLAGMFGQQGYRVKRLSRISPRLDNYDTIIWFPDDFAPPSDEAIVALEGWLSEDYGRQLIYVGRDYDAAVEYLQHLANSDASGETATSRQSEEIRRRLAEAKLNQDQRSSWNRSSTSETCEWFDLAETPRQPVTKLGGPWSENVAVTRSAIQRATWLKPSANWSTEYGTEIVPLLTTDGYDFAWQADFYTHWGDENQLVVISNGSFLLNYGLVNRENRKLAAALIDHCELSSDIVFLESGPEGIAISNSDIPNHNTWAWIAQPPLRYIVPHFLMWSVLFCFVFFPIFGRPKKWLPKTSATGKPLPHREETSFRNHIVAMGKLLQRGDHFDAACEKIKQYEQSTEVSRRSAT